MTMSLSLAFALLQTTAGTPIPATICDSALAKQPAEGIERALPPLGVRDWVVVTGHQYALPLIFVQGAGGGSLARYPLATGSLRTALDRLVREFPGYRWACFGTGPGRLAIYPESEAYLTWRLAAQTSPTTVKEAVARMTKLIDDHPSQGSLSRVKVYAPIDRGTVSEWMITEKVTLKEGTILNQIAQIAELEPRRLAVIRLVRTNPSFRLLDFGIYVGRDGRLPLLSADLRKEPETKP